MLKLVIHNDIPKLIKTINYKFVTLVLLHPLFRSDSLTPRPKRSTLTLRIPLLLRTSALLIIPSDMMYCFYSTTDSLFPRHIDVTYKHQINNLIRFWPFTLLRSTCKRQQILQDPSSPKCVPLSVGRCATVYQLRKVSRVSDSSWSDNSGRCASGLELMIFGRLRKVSIMTETLSGWIKSECTVSIASPFKHLCSLFCCFQNLNSCMLQFGGKYIPVSCTSIETRQIFELFYESIVVCNETVTGWIVAVVCDMFLPLHESQTSKVHTGVHFLSTLPGYRAAGYSGC